MSNSIGGGREMHANTVETRFGVRTRSVDALVVSEVESFCPIQSEYGNPVGGVHLEMSVEPVTECADPGLVPEEYDPREHFTSLMDPRPNARQAATVVDALADSVRSV
jgi:3-deoxy-7-phosphoheptulonate synthase